MPQDSDTLEEMLGKLKKLAAVVEQGGNIAVATGFKMVPEDYGKVARTIVDVTISRSLYDVRIIPQSPCRR